ncbi:hypothetical protein [Streptomyces sp. NBC_01803]|uniref:hypothetical protein n=1 Tax=Streptomyces sp. NBC_01803 TaxID=2975946 RepID=UPI002DDB12A3|nr:hypothetical protein [Streptomyces sp. NBC_01803]WSA43582.1 hypothetical protein OIE51_04820 [Streptomyces sp. NBC_01803]
MRASTPHEGLTARRLPPDREAFVALHHGHYLSYARLHLPAPAAEAVVGAVFDHLFRCWRRFLSSPNPASHAWCLLTDRIRDEADRPCPALSPAQYDAYALHHLLGYQPADVATAMGEEEDTVRFLLRSPGVRGLLTGPP